LAVNNDDGSNWEWIRDYVIALTMRSDRFFLVIVTFWQIIHCSLQTKTNKKCVLWQRNRTMPLYRNVQRHRAVLPAIARLLSIRMQHENSTWKSLLIDTFSVNFSVRNLQLSVIKLELSSPPQFFKPTTLLFPRIEYRPYLGCLLWTKSIPILLPFTLQGQRWGGGTLLLEGSSQTMYVWHKNITLYFLYLISIWNKTT